ncbi:Golgi-specific brefeldin A-resistance guanine nucleotide exchange factor 1-like [Anneissia japonica]|uniref:Golgi-specific brefeldin A-resistance guanine nucleotide exchange factor 1-like n=1 Tax=Anneissia japonica TaxID=1529436 RepID=UPI001425932C|nr:Golgi-specific brefeldin A-resistance guanine nucleotide exchange factor 1-like [Anneissia japonica]
MSGKISQPKNGVYIIQGEMLLVVTAMRRTSRWNTHIPQEEEQDPLIAGFSQLKDLLNSVSELNDIEPNNFLTPFLDVIRSEDTTGPITGLALSSVNKFLSYGLLDPGVDGTAAGIENIADAVTHARFVGTDPGSDEVVLMKILQVLRTLLLTPVGCHLTNESVCEIMQSCFRICFEMRLSELLRRSAEQTLVDMVQLLFSRLPQFKEEKIAGMRKLKMRAGGIADSRRKKSKQSPKNRQKKEKQSTTIAVQEERESTATSGQPSPAVSDNNIASEVEEPESVPEDRQAEERLQSSDGEADGREVVSIDDCAPTPDADPSEHVVSLTGGQGIEDGIERKKEEEANYDSEKTESLADGLEDSESITEHSDSASVHDSDYVNPHGVRFTPQQKPKDGSGPLIPYGLPCVRELFRFLISLINPYDRHNTDVMIHMGLSLLTISLETGCDHISHFSVLQALVKDDMCRHLFSLLQADRLSLFASSVRVCFLLFESMRTHLKFQLEMYLLKLVDLIVSESPKIMYEQREMALDAIVQLWRIPSLVAELYLNYDCDIYCTNLFEDLTKLLSKNAFPVSGSLYTTHLLSLDALLAVIDAIEANCHHRILSTIAAQSTERIAAESGIEIQVQDMSTKQEGKHLTRPACNGYILNSNHRPFANNDAAFTLAYAVIMLNVDQHNHNAKKQNIPMTIAEFKKNLNKVNGGEDFEQSMLEEVYSAIRNEEIVMPAEQTGLVRENYIWRCLLKRGTTPDGIFLHTPAAAMDKELFLLTWGPTVAALSFVFDKSSDETITQKAISGFRKCAMISAHYGLSDVFDNLAISLCKFTTLMSSGESPETLPIVFGSNMKAQLAAKTMFGLAHRHGDILGEGWKNILDCMLQLFKAKLLPSELVEVEDFVASSGSISLLKREEMPSQKSDSSLLSSFVYYFTANTETSTQRGPTPEDQEAIHVARNCIEDCHPEHLLTESKFLRIDSLQDLLKALIFASQGPQAAESLGTPFDEEAAVFNLELLIRVVFENRDRVSSLWQSVRDHLYSLIVSSSEHGFLVERAVVGLLRLAIRMLRREEISGQVIASLRMLFMMRPSILHKQCRQISHALYELLRTNAANIHTPMDWYTLFTLLECVGAGSVPPPMKQVSIGTESDDCTSLCGDADAQSDSELSVSSQVTTVSDHGYTSDTELYNTQKPKRSSSEGDVRDIGRGGWLVVKKDTDEKKQPHNQYEISLNVELRHHDTRSLLKCCEILAFLVRDAAHVTPDNFESCVHCIRTFVEATVNGVCYFQLLDLMHTLHTKAATIFNSWAEEQHKSGELHTVDAGASALWVKCWCPLLQGIARLCCDTRRQVRMQAFSYLQRALLVHDLQTLSATEWESSFNIVLFPLLAKLLTNINSQDPVGVEETRMRAATLLCKVFLQHLSPLLSLSTFTALWLTILDFMDKYMHADKSDLLFEAIPESLKNMLLVMHTAGILSNDGHDQGEESQLWLITWERIDCFLPQLKNELFRPREIPKPKVEAVNTADAPKQDSSIPRDGAPPVKDPEQQKTNGAVESPGVRSASPAQTNIILQPPLPSAVPVGHSKHGASVPILLNPHILQAEGIQGLPILSVSVGETATTNSS